MFNFNNLKRLTKYDYSNIVNDSIPKAGKKAILSKELFDDILSGAILLLGGCALKTLSDFMFAIFIAINNLDLFNGINLFGLATNLNFSIAFPLFIPIAVIIYNYIFKDKEQYVISQYIIMLILLLLSIGEIFSIITYIVTTVIYPLAGLFGIISILVSLVGNLFIILACLDFCLENKEKKTETKKNEKIKLKTISKDEVSLHVNHCSKCNIDVVGNYCNVCGKKLK